MAASLGKVDLTPTPPGKPGAATIETDALPGARLPAAGRGDVHIFERFGQIYVEEGEGDTVQRC